MHPLGFQESVERAREIVIRVILCDIDLQADDPKPARTGADFHGRRDRAAIDTDGERRNAINDRVLAEQNDLSPGASFRTLAL
jgi:hypothetical protein